MLMAILMGVVESKKKVVGNSMNGIISRPKEKKKPNPLLLVNLNHMKKLI